MGFPITSLPGDYFRIESYLGNIELRIIVKVTSKTVTDNIGRRYYRKNGLPVARAKHFDKAVF